MESIADGRGRASRAECVDGFWDRMIKMFKLRRLSCASARGRQLCAIYLNGRTQVLSKGGTESLEVKLGEGCC